MWIEIVQVPPQTPKQILARLKQHIQLVSETLVQVVNVLLHVPWAIPCRDDGALGLEQERKCFLPFVHRSRVAETRVEDNKAVKVRVIWVEVSGFVQGVVVIHISADFHGIGYAIFDNGTKGVEWCTWGKGKFFLAVGHAFGSNEVERKLYAMEEVRELHPGLSWKGRLGACTKDEETHRGRCKLGVLPGVAAACARRVKSVSQRCELVSFWRLKRVRHLCLPLKLFKPSGVIRPFLRRL
jgi:hypothetical protein